MPTQVLDFYPWTGHHPEDDLNETVVKGGYLERAQGANQQECNSARPVVWPFLIQKNHTGLMKLAHLYTTVMEKRQAMAKHTTSSSFKPPPRVTVPDTKREAWLRDLANPEVPLRRQSRSIPHGIRGKRLMEQCLNKEIPLQRAVWLAKSIGANELRAFRRKGVSGSAAASGEFKWIREWTVQVEQFLESVIASGRQPHWRRKMNYATRLATFFYSEKLLDNNHYLDWLISSLRETSLERLPILLVLVQLHFKDLMGCGKRGRRLVEGLLEQLQKLSTGPGSLQEYLRPKIQELVATLAATRSSCLIIPHVWEKYSRLLRAETFLCDHYTRASLNLIANRNERLAAPIHSKAPVERCKLLDLYSSLDSVGLESEVGAITHQALHLLTDSSNVVNAVLDWASTPYRTGAHRTFLAAQIIMQMRQSGNDSDGAVLQYMKSVNVANFAVENVHRVVVELIRLGAFSVGRYLQWLITSGLLSADEDISCATGLISALPTTNLPVNVLNTRRTLMARLGCLPEAADATESILDRLEAPEVAAAPESVTILTSMTMAAKLDIAQRAVEWYSTRTIQVNRSADIFCVTRTLLEDIGDYRSLAALVRAAVSSDSGALIASAADTTTVHALTFASMGQFAPLVDIVMNRYLAMRAHYVVDETATTALANLAQLAPGREAFLNLCKRDLTNSCQQHVMACSPASDSLIEMHATHLDSDADLDAVFTSGNTMDDLLLRRVFARIMQRTTKDAKITSVGRVYDWLRQLRKLDGGESLNQCVSAYLTAAFSADNPKRLSISGLVSLLLSGCVSLEQIADRAKDGVSSSTANSILRLCITPVDFGAPPSGCYAYRLRVKQSCCERRRPDLLVQLLQKACQAAEFDFNDECLQRFIVRRILAHDESMHQFFACDHLPDIAMISIRRLLMSILKVGSSVRDLQGTQAVQEIIELANPLSLSFSLCALHSFRKPASAAHATTEGAVKPAILQSITAGSEIWPQILGSTSVETKRDLFDWAAEQLLSCAIADADPDADRDRNRVPTWMHILTMTSSSVKRVGATGNVAPISEHLEALHDRLVAGQLYGPEGQTRLENIVRRLRMMLPLCVFHVHFITDETEASRQGRGNLLRVLCGLLMHPRLQPYADMVNFISDLCSTMADHVADALKQSIREKLPLHPHLDMILGDTHRDMDTWLALVSAVKPAAPQKLRNMGQRVLSQHLQATSARGGSQQPNGLPESPSTSKQDSQTQLETKVTPFPLRRWETTIAVGDETSLNLSLFAARKV